MLDQRYALTEHAYLEMDADKLDVLDVESAILTGRIHQVLTDDLRGPRYVVHGKACDEVTPVAAVVRFVANGQALVITVYQLSR
ncbi:MAG: DUF4258 domain-containing protein [Planctomycetota bacterium]